MRVVLDTNVVVAGLLWNGHPRHLLELAIDGHITLCGNPALIDELAHTLNYPKFSQRIAMYCATTPSALTVRYGALVTLVTPTEVPQVIEEDADDDQVLACALAGKANLIVSGDKHLLGLGGVYQGIRIVNKGVRLLFSHSHRRPEIVAAKRKAIAEMVPWLQTEPDSAEFPGEGWTMLDDLLWQASSLSGFVLNMR